MCTQGRGVCPVTEGGVQGILSWCWILFSSLPNYLHHCLSPCDDGGKKGEWDLPPGRAAFWAFNFFLQKSIGHRLLTSGRWLCGWQSHELLKVALVLIGPRWYFWDCLRAVGLRLRCWDAWDRAALRWSTVSVTRVCLSLWQGLIAPCGTFSCAFPALF